MLDPYRRGCGAAGGAGFPLNPVVTGPGWLSSKTGSNREGATGIDIILDIEGTEGTAGGGAEGGGGLFAASNAFAWRSLSLPASMIPESVPVRNVATGIINSKNLLSTGLMPFMGCVTKIRLYSTTKTIPNNVKPRIIPIKNFKRAFSSLSEYFGPDHKSLIIYNPRCINFAYYRFYQDTL